MMKQDLSALFLDDRCFDFWEKKTKWTRKLHVSTNDSAASDDNDVSAASLFRTIGRTGFPASETIWKAEDDPGSSQRKKVKAVEDLPWEQEGTVFPGPICKNVLRREEPC